MSIGFRKVFEEFFGIFRGSLPCGRIPDLVFGKEGKHQLPVAFSTSRFAPYRSRKTECSAAPASWRSARPVLPDGFKGETPVQVHRSFDAQSSVAVIGGGTGGVRATAPLIDSPEGQSIRQPLQQFCCRLILRLDILTGLSCPPRLSYRKIPVETMTPP